MIQIKMNDRVVLQLILDMKVRWSSTYLMLDRAERKKQVHHNSKAKIVIYHLFSQSVDAFVDELRWEEQDSSKRDKIRELKLTTEEWARVNIFLDLLSVCLSLSSTYNSLMYFSMPIMPNKPSHLTKSRSFIWQFPHSRPFTGHGLLGLTVQNTSRLRLLFMQHVKRLMSTTRKLRSLLHTLCQ
jgi:hypothetical protein